jgi:hypothetical protein
MKKLIISISVFLLFGCSINCFALDKFLNYKNISPAESTNEDVPVVPDANYAIKQGYINTYELTANVNKAITVPTGAKFILFTANNDIWVKVGGTAAIPSGDTTDGTGAELNPILRYIGSETTIGVISESATKISVMCWK